MKFVFGYLKKRLPLILILAVCGAVFATVNLLYGLPPKASLYPIFICSIFLFIFLSAECITEYRKHKKLRELCRLPDDLVSRLSELNGVTDEDYREIIELILKRESELIKLTADRETDMTDYYTTWVHQIKTPIASMRLSLEGEDSKQARRLSGDLFRIEQYVDMVLTYLRLNSESVDYVIREQSLAPIVKGAVKRFAPMFIGYGIHLELGEIDASIVTDGKWLSFVIEQVISNSLKYTPGGGSISIFLKEPLTLCIADTGIGIAEEDVPRVFERGYTGINGRINKRASGIGLYLCKRICKELGCGISISSKSGEGTCVEISFDRKKIEFE